MNQIPNIVVALMLSIGSAHAAQKPSSALPAMVESQEASMTAEVEKIDYGGRHITLRDEQGNTQSFTAPPEVKNFDQIKKGDKVVVDYYRSVLVEMAEPGESGKLAMSSQTDTVKVAPPGKTPSATKASVRRTTVTILDIDKDNGTVTLALPNRETKTVTVREERRPMLDRVKVGDKIQITMTEAIAVALRKP